MDEKKGTQLLKEIDASCWPQLLDQSFEGAFFIDVDKNILFWNKGAEAISGYSATETIGRKCNDKLLAPIDEEGRHLCSKLCPVNKVLAAGLPQHLEIFIHHKEGYRLPVMMRIVPLYNEKHEILGLAHIFVDTSPRLSMPPRVEELTRLDLIDQQTLIGNRAFLKIYLQSRLQEMQKFGLPFGILLVDIDHLGEINDLYGRLTGDRIVSMVARTLLSNLRFVDVLGRWGDDEFLAIVTNVDEAKLDVVANKLRLLVQNSFIFADGRSVSTTVSIGATMARKRDTVKELTDRAEKFMYHSKWLGRNRVVTRISATG